MSFSGVPSSSIEFLLINIISPIIMNQVLIFLDWLRLRLSCLGHTL
nr:MAG TPA: hypothetical protein [Caudoviricetes sp.]